MKLVIGNYNYYSIPFIIWKLFIPFHLYIPFINYLFIQDYIACYFCSLLEREGREEAVPRLAVWCVLCMCKCGHGHAMRLCLMLPREISLYLLLCLPPTSL